MIPSSTAAPIRNAMRLRLDSLMGQLNGYLMTYQSSADLAMNQFNSDALAANQKYWDAVYKPVATPVSAYDTYLGTLASEETIWLGYLQQDFAAYRTSSSAAFTPVLPPLSGGITGMIPPPSPSSLSGAAIATKEYWIQAGIDTAIY